MSVYDSVLVTAI